MAYKWEFSFRLNKCYYFIVEEHSPFQLLSLCLNLAKLSANMRESPPRQEAKAHLRNQWWGWNGSRENPGQANLPYTSSRDIFPSFSNQSAPRLIKVTRSPAFAPGVKWGFRSAGGSTAKVKAFSCSRMANEPGSELPARVMAVIFQSFTAWVIPLLISYQLARGTLTRPKTAWGMAD